MKSKELCNHRVLIRSHMFMISWEHVQKHTRYTLRTIDQILDEKQHDVLVFKTCFQNKCDILRKVTSFISKIHQISQVDSTNDNVLKLHYLQHSNNSITRTIPKQATE